MSALKHALIRLYSDRTRQRQYDGVIHNALDLEHILVNRSIQTCRVASKKLYIRDVVDLTLARPVWIDPNAPVTRPYICQRTPTYWVTSDKLGARFI